MNTIGQRLTDPTSEARETAALQGLRVPAMDLGRLHSTVRHELVTAFEHALDTSSFVGGAAVAELEQSLAEYVGTQHAVGVGSGTAALHLALVAAGIGPGDEVLVPANTFIATAEAVVAAGADPVLVDVDPTTALMDADAAAAAVGPCTAAVVPVHLYGQTVAAEPFSALAQRHGLFLLEDSAQAIGADWNGRRAGSIGDAAGFSFYPGKNLGALGDAGAVTTDDAALARRVRSLRSHGEQRKYVHEVPGWCERLDALQAAFLSVKLRHLDADQALRDASVTQYRERLADHPVVRLLEVRDGARHVHHQLVVRVPERDLVQQRLADAGITCLIHYPVPVHRQPAFSDRFAGQSFPHTESLAASILSLPLFPGLTDAELEAVCDRLDDATADLLGHPLAADRLEGAEA